MGVKMDMLERVARAIFYKRADLEQWHSNSPAAP
jgi:hypothetical protein